jgi:phosphoribosylaminoimidazole-succinocarboxamide synthase
MKQGVPHKGKILHSLTKWWMENLDIPHHFVTDDLEEIGSPWKDHPEMFGGRTMLVKKFKALPIEAIVRGYICGSAWQEYQKTGIVCGIKLPSDMHKRNYFEKR